MIKNRLRSITTDEWMKALIVILAQKGTYLHPFPMMSLMASLQALVMK